MFLCNKCWNKSLKWAGQCIFCKEWNSLVEFKESKNESKISWISKKLEKIENIKNINNRIKSKSNELNNVLGGWIVNWSIILLSWEPGIWKSTLSLQLSSWIENINIIYISWEETPSQISTRANRLWIKTPNLYILWENCVENILESLKNTKNSIIIIDSISVMHSNNINWVSWSISQVKYISEIIIQYAKDNENTIFIIWHINKDWALAWPKTLEHMVDTVLFFEWEKYDNIRILRTFKNRFWSTNEIWIFNMHDKWLSDIKNPWFEFINSNDSSIWSSLSIAIEWTRAIVIETESLTNYTKFAYPKRSARWINASKLELIIAVISKYTWISLDSYDVYINIVRGLKIEDPWIDLSIAASIISSKTNKTIEKNIIFIWEISLTWKIKKTINIEKRVKEAEKMWFKTIYIPDTNIESKNINLIKLKDIKELLKYL